ncbi:probable RNA-directed DNA polymerase from transposon X-element [Trichonephila clavipes]|nr:probable RNA-directed DNA polymerase from transposon X-element [Trichonephila clavipes]
MTTEQADQERYTEAYLDFHKSWENRMNTCVINLNNCRTSEEATTVIRAIEEIDTQLREFPFNRPEDQSSNLRQLGDVLDEAKFKFTHIRKMELAEQNKLLQAQIDAWGLPSKPVDAPFQVILSKKKGRRNSGDNGLDSKKAKTSDIIETQNQFSGLLTNNEDTMDVVDPQEGTSSATSHPGVTAPQKKPHVPPINIDNVKNQAALLQHLQTITKQKLEAKLIGTKFRIYPKTPYAYHQIRRYIEENSLESHTYMLPEDKLLRAVIRGLPTDMSPTQIIADLENQGFHIKDCHNMQSKKTGQPMPLFMLSMESNEAHKKIFKTVTSIGFVKCQVEALRKKYGPPQCFRCQGFFHSSKILHPNTQVCQVRQNHLAKDCKNQSMRSRNVVSARENTQRTTSTAQKTPGIGSPKRRRGRKTRRKKPTLHLNRLKTDRTCRGGGTAILIKRSIPHHEIVINNPSFETTAIIIERTNLQPITVISAYRSPRKPILIQDLHQLFRNQDYVLVAGDLNAKHASWSPIAQQNVAGHTIRRFCDSTGYSLNAPLEPTHFHKNLRNTVIDLAICKGMTITDVTSIPELSSDHNPVLFEVCLDNFTAPALSTYAFPNWKKFQEILTNSLPGNPIINSTNDIETAINNFNFSLKNAYNNRSIFKSINKPLNTIPSIIRDKIKLKNRIRKDWQDTKYPPYKTQLNKLQKEIKKELQNYHNFKWDKLLAEATPDDDSLYKIVKTHSNKNKSFHIPPIVGPMGLHYSTEDKVNLFADSLESSFQENPEPYDDDFIDRVEEKIENYMDRNARRHTAPLTSPEEVMDIILKLNNKKAPGHDGIKNIALKSLPLNAITYITKIFNRSLQFNYFPKEWKHAQITVLPKPKKDPKFAENYRPISLLSCLGKIFEKIILTRIIDHCDRNNLIPDFQHGFRKETSTQHQLLRVTNNIINGFNTKSYTVGIFLDRERHRGSILSPALYNIYTSDFPTTPSVSVCLFADDAAILCNNTTADQAVRTSQAYLSQLEIWLTKWRISINTEKTNAIIFRKRRSQSMPTQLKLFDETIDWTFETSYLGLTLNDNLTYRPHFNEIKKNTGPNTSPSSSCLKEIKTVVKNRIFIFKTYLRPILTYGCAIWGAAGNNHLEDLQRLQNKVLRIIARAPRFIPRSVLHEELRVEPIHTLIANLSSNFHSSIPYHNNPTINSQNYFRNLPPSTHRMPHSSANISPSF